MCVITSANMSAIGFLVNGKTKKLLEKFNLGVHQFYDVKVFDTNNKYQYYWLHLIDLDIRTFYKNQNIIEMSIYDRIYNLPLPYSNLDLFKTIGNRRIFASQKLIDAIIEKNIIGFEYEEVEK